MIYCKASYSLGLTGYELWVNDDDLRDDTIHVLYVGAQPEQIARRYKLQNRNTLHPRSFVRVHGRRIYLDECIKEAIQ